MPVTKTTPAQIIVRGESKGQAVLNVLHYKVDDIEQDTDQTTIQAVVDEFAIRHKAWALPLACSTYTVLEYYGVVVTGREPNPHWLPPGKPGQYPFRLTFGEQYVNQTAGWTGTRVGNPLPTFNALAIRHIAEEKRPWTRGGARWFVGVEADTNSNEWEAAFLTEAQITQDYVGQLRTFDAPPGGDIVNVTMCTFGKTSYLQAPNSPVPQLGDYLSELSSVALNKYVSSQVSRKQRVRFN